ncbi:hypothetical protein PC117_g21808 [Phytophthora cactorum]|uniref:Uncharacterized protein n=1 Tax=Phytophthora cactorum TaxID=29920 RepID=A0A8T1BG62_9STRA|nr:hypothetical protein PC117_g21808 [Phytophthora cactorum]KAG2990999.1 hypothetical protein PC120_g22800 [Phytophthora cactorum]
MPPSLPTPVVIEVDRSISIFRVSIAYLETPLATTPWSYSRPVVRLMTPWVSEEARETGRRRGRSGRKWDPFESLRAVVRLLMREAGSEDARAGCGCVDRV